jgi:hypothetical protein
MVTSITAIGLVWKWLFNNDYGLINYLISLFGISPVNWLNDPKYNLAALIIYGVWSMLPADDHSASCRVAECQSAVLCGGARGRGEERQNFLSHHAAAAGADDRAYEYYQHDLCVQSVYGTLSAL